MRQLLYIDESTYRDLEQLGRLGHPSKTADEMAQLILQTFTQQVIDGANADIRERLLRLLDSALKQNQSSASAENT